MTWKLPVSSLPLMTLTLLAAAPSSFAGDSANEKSVDVAVIQSVEETRTPEASEQGEVSTLSQYVSGSLAPQYQVTFGPYGLYGNGFPTSKQVSMNISYTSGDNIYLGVCNQAGTCAWQGPFTGGVARGTWTVSTPGGIVYYWFAIGNGGSSTISYSGYLYP